MDNKKNKYIERYLDAVSKKKTEDQRLNDDIKRTRSNGRVKWLINCFEKPLVGKLTKTRIGTIGNIGTIHIATNVIECLDDVLRKEHERYSKYKKKK